MTTSAHCDVAAHCVFEAQHDVAETCALLGGSVALFSRRAPDKETTNEDAAAVLEVGPQCGVLVVADGLGGHARGETASRLAIEHLEQSLAQLADETDGTPDAERLRVAILNAFEAANTAIRDLGTGAATTLAVAEYQAGVIRPYHVGDSAVWLIGQRGKIKLQTLSHSPVAYAVEAGMLDESDAISHAERHLISNVMGSDEMRIDVGAPIRMAPRDTLLLTTDGLLDNLHAPEIVALVRKGPLAAAVNRLTNVARDRMHQQVVDDLPCKPDDLTVVAFRQR